MLKFLNVFLLTTLLQLGMTWAQVDPHQLTQATRERFEKVPEFQYLKEQAEKLGLKVYLFGGTASAFAHYVRLDLEREAGDTKYQAERFDYDFTNIYRGNQDLDIVVDGTAEQAESLRQLLIAQYPHFIGNKEAWEIRLLRAQIGDKQPLLNDKDFLNQHTDSNSTGLLDVTARVGDIVYRDLFDWENRDSQFLRDVSQAKISYYFSKNHDMTGRYREGKNPPLLSAIRYIAKLTQYEVRGTPEDMAIVKKIIREENDEELSSYSKQKAFEFGRKALLNAPNIEFAWDLLEETGLRRKLIKLDGNREGEQDTLSWWMNKEPLRSKPLGQGDGRTAQEIAEELKLKELIVSHETREFQAYENITRSAKGEANVFISRQNTNGEGAAHGDGFYTQIGMTGAVGSGITIRFRVHPEAREGVDFTYTGSFVVVHNKNALELIQENMNVSLLDYFKLTVIGEISNNDKGLMTKMERKFIRQEVSDEEVAEIADFISGLIKENKSLNYTLNLWFRVKSSPQHPELVRDIISSVNSELRMEVVDHLFSNRHWNKHIIEFLGLLIDKRNVSLTKKIIEVFSKNKIDEEMAEILFDRFIKNNYITVDLIVAAAPYEFWINRRDLIDKIISEEQLDRTLTQHVFSKPGMEKHADLLDKLLDKNNLDKEMFESILNKKHWNGHGYLVEREINRGSYDLTLSNVLAHPHWFSQKNLYELVLSKSNAELSPFFPSRYGSSFNKDGILGHEEWDADPVFMEKLIRAANEEQVGVLLNFYTNKPDWPISPEIFKAFLDKKVNFDALSQVLLNPGWEEYPELFEALLEKEVHSQHLIEILSTDQWSKHQHLTDKLLLSPGKRLGLLIKLMATEGFVGRDEFLLNFINVHEVR